mgnify:CR=1 FL=1
MDQKQIFYSVLIILVSLSFGACASQQQEPLSFSFNQIQPPADSHEHDFGYFNVQKKWTRHTEVFDHFEGRLFTSATLISPAFEQIRVKRHQKKLGLSVDESTQLLAKRLKQSQSGYLFFVTLSSSDAPKLQRPNIQKKVEEVIKGREDELKASLLIDGNIFSLSQIDQLSFKRGQALHNDFPYITPVKTGYWLYFEVPADFTATALAKKSESHTQHKFQLRFSSLSATALLEWDLSFQ